MSNALSDRELSSALRSLFKRFNRLTENRLGEQVLLLEYKLRCAVKFKEPRMLELSKKQLGLEMAQMGKHYEYVLSRYREACFIGKLKIFWHQFSK